MCTSYICIPYIFTASHLASSHLTSSHLASAHLTSMFILLRPAALATKNCSAATLPHEMSFDRRTSRKSTEIQAPTTSFLPNLLFFARLTTAKIAKANKQTKFKMWKHKNSKCENISNIIKQRIHFRKCTKTKDWLKTYYLFRNKCCILVAFCGCAYRILGFCAFCQMAVP